MEARQLLSRVLLGADGSSFRLRRNESFMGRRALRFYLVGEDNSEPLDEPSGRSFVDWLGGLDFSESRNLNRSSVSVDGAAGNEGKTAITLFDFPEATGVFLPRFGSVETQGRGLC